MRHVRRGLRVPALRARAPGPARSQRRIGRDFYPRAEPVAERDALHRAAVLVVGHVQCHRRGVDVVEVVEAVSGVAVARSGVPDVSQARGPE